jgi:hypothetical protein
MALGRIINSLSGAEVGEVEYTFLNDSAYSWWGELIFIEHCRVAEGDGYLLEVEDGRRGKCSLIKRVNKATYGIPSRYYYRFQGTGLLV